MENKLPTVFLFDRKIMLPFGDKVIINPFPTVPEMVTCQDQTHATKGDQILHARTAKQRDKMICFSNTKQTKRSRSRERHGFFLSPLNYPATTVFNLKKLYM